ncbi:MAG: hypothetical protein ACE5J9_01630 [Methanosarcinales archaeon]
MKIKICGNKSKRDLEIAFKYGADAVGFIVPESSSYSKKNLYRKGARIN